MVVTFPPHRKQRISDNFAPFVDYDYIGPSRVERRVSSPNFSSGRVETDYQYDGISGIPNPSSCAGGTIVSCSGLVVYG